MGKDMAQLEYALSRTEGALHSLITFLAGSGGRTPVQAELMLREWVEEAREKCYDYNAETALIAANALAEAEGGSTIAQQRRRAADLLEQCNRLEALRTKQGRDAAIDDADRALAAIRAEPVEVGSREAMVIMARVDGEAEPVRRSA